MRLAFQQLRREAVAVSVNGVMQVPVQVIKDPVHDATQTLLRVATQMGIALTLQSQCLLQPQHHQPRHRQVRSHGAVGANGVMHLPVVFIQMMEVVQFAAWIGRLLALGMAIVKVWNPLLLLDQLHHHHRTHLHRQLLPSQKRTAKRCWVGMRIGDLTSIGGTQTIHTIVRWDACGRECFSKRLPHIQRSTMALLS